MISSNILIVDDEADLRRLTRNVLAPMGYRLREAADGEEALQEVQKEIPDLIILDVRMPGRDGFSVCQQLKQDVKTKLIPIIILTSLHQVEDRITGIESGADEFISKPFLATDLRARVKSLLALKHYTDELENVAFVLKGIAQVVEYRDAYTAGHLKRVADYGATVALSMGLEADEVNTIRLGGLLHDLGKIGIPDSILRKPGSLNNEERTIMKTHAAAGATLVEPMNTMGKVLPFIRHHHERLDGSGYPDGISARKIPLALRILTVVDIYDALATDRPYKKAYPHKECMAILHEEARRGWWDRDVIECLEKSLAVSASAS